MAATRRSMSVSCCSTGKFLITTRRKSYTGGTFVLTTNGGRVGSVYLFHRLPHWPVKVPMIVRRSCARVLMGLIASLVLTAWPASAQDPITRAKTLYESADYDQALAVLDQLKSDPLAESVPDVAAYRVFCLLALGRSAEANENIAAILRRDPRYQPSETDASPRI